MFGRLLAVVAIGDHLKAPQAEPTDDLVIENDLDTGNQQAQAARKRLVEAALSALKEEVGESHHLKRSLWAAVNSDILSVDEIQATLDFCRMMYEPIDSFMVKIRYPRYWKLEHLGKGKLKFSRTQHVRTKPFVKWVPKAPSPVKKYDLLPPKPSVPKIYFKNPAPPAPPPPAAKPPAQLLAPERQIKSDGSSEPRSGLKLKFTRPKPAPG